MGNGTVFLKLPLFAYAVNTSVVCFYWSLYARLLQRFCIYFHQPRAYTMAGPRFLKNKTEKKLASLIILQLYYISIIHARINYFE
jgi:hypothetical protein